MSLMATRVGLTHRAEVERTSGAIDAWGSPARDWQPHLAALPCRAWTVAGRQPVADGRTVTTEDRRVLVPLGTDITTMDRLVRVTSRNGAVVLDGVMTILAVLTHPDHLELVVEAVNP